MASSKSTVEVVVLKGRSIQHDGKSYSENSVAKIDEDSAQSLIEAGFVKKKSELIEQAKAADKVSVNTNAGASITVAENAAVAANELKPTAEEQAAANAENVVKMADDIKDAAKDDKPADKAEKA